MKRINSQVMKNHNVVVILNTVQQLGPISRTDLTNAVGLTTASVTNITNGLIDAGILKCVGTDSQTGFGRKAIMLDLNAEAYHVIGVSLNTESIHVVVTDFRGEIVEQVRQSIWNHDLPAQILQQVKRCVELAVEKSGASWNSVIGIGLSVPGPLDIQSGVLMNPPNLPGWDGISPLKWLEDAFHVPVCCDRESNVAVMAEYFEKEKTEKYHTAMFVSLFRLGVGSGYINNGNLLHGFQNGAGELGHTTVDLAGPRCTCGNYGCLETLLSEKNLVDHAKKLYKLQFGTVQENIDDLTLEEVFARCEQGEAICAMVVRQAAGYLAVGLGNAINLYSPQCIVLGGTLPEMSPKLVQWTQEAIVSRAYPYHCKDIEVTKSKYGELAFAKGATAMALNQFLPNVVAHFNQLQSPSNL